MPTDHARPAYRLPLTLGLLGVAIGAAIGAAAGAWWIMGVLGGGLSTLAWLPRRKAA